MAAVAPDDAEAFDEGGDEKTEAPIYDLMDRTTQPPGYAVFREARGSGAHPCECCVLNGAVYREVVYGRNESPLCLCFPCCCHAAILNALIYSLCVHVPCGRACPGRRWPCCACAFAQPGGLGSGPRSVCHFDDRIRDSMGPGWTKEGPRIFAPDAFEVTRGE